MRSAISKAAKLSFSPAAFFSASVSHGLHPIRPGGGQIVEFDPDPVGMTGPLINRT